MSDAELIDYTDPDIIARQNIAPNAGCNIDGKFYDVQNLVHLASSQGDRIETLTKERDDYAHKLMQANNTYTEMHLEIERLSDKLATCEKYRDAYDEMGRIGTQAVRDLEAKLAKAVEALDMLVRDCEADYPPSHGAIKHFAIAALAELKGESHE